jgi:mannose-6-phosphate isomerase-like protein (cupin superfamily)
VSEGVDLAKLFPAGTAVSHLAVYDWAGPDGQRGGSAHVHLACTEGYVVTNGTGRLQTLSRDGFAETPLRPMTVAWFSPGVVHRLINDGGLQIVVIMQNGGLPEAGDSVLTFPPSYLADPDAYRSVAALDDAAKGSLADAARRRRELAVEGFLLLREQLERDGARALADFYAAAGALVQARASAWRDMWAHGPLAAALRTGEQLAELASGRHAHLWQGSLTVLNPPDERSYGMCGKLAAYPAYGAEQLRSLPSG